MPELSSEYQVPRTTILKSEQEMREEARQVRRWEKRARKDDPWLAIGEPERRVFKEEHLKSSRSS